MLIVLPLLMVFVCNYLIDEDDMEKGASLVSVGIAFFVLTLILGTVTTIWLNFDWPTMVGFWQLIVPAILGISQLPVLGTFVSIISWVATFETAMLVTRLVLWLGNALQGSIDTSLAR